MTDDSELNSACEQGRREAIVFDARLRDCERRERDDLVSHRFVVARDPRRVENSTPLPPAAEAALRRLRREAVQLGAFHDAVRRSVGWNTLELLRLPFGRSWTVRARAVLPAPDGGDEILHLERRVVELERFRAAVVGSRGWRLLQTLRRPLGRAW